MARGGAPDGLDRWAERLSGELEAAVAAALDGERKAAVAFSGGVDSSLIALLASRRLDSLELCTVGMGGARDLPDARLAALALGLGDRLRAVELDEPAVLGAAARIRELFPEATLTEVSFLAPSFLVFSHVDEKMVLTVDGADELFGGYHRYLSMDTAGLAAALGEDAGRLVSHGILRNRRLAEEQGRTLSTPFLDPRVVELAAAIPPGMKVAGGERKLVLRRAAALLGLPPGICARPKRAAQYGSGILCVVKKNWARG